MKRFDSDEVILWALAIAAFTLSVLMAITLVFTLIGIAKGEITL